MGSLLHRVAVFAGLEIAIESIHQPLFFHNNNNNNKKPTNRNQMAWFSASTSKCFVKWNVLLFAQKSVWMKDAWRNWWNLRFVGHFNIQVIIPSEMYCKWTVCLTFLSVCSSPSTSQFATSTSAKIRLFCWLPLPYFNGRPFRDLLQNARIKLLPDQRCSVFIESMQDFKDFTFIRLCSVQ